MAGHGTKDEVTLLPVRVQPRASRNALSVGEDGRVRVALTAAPVDGAANQALTALVAKTLRLPKRAVTVVKGEKSRVKILGLEGVSLEEATLRLGQQRST